MGSRASLRWRRGRGRLRAYKREVEVTGGCMRVLAGWNSSAEVGREGTGRNAGEKLTRVVQLGLVACAAV